MAETARGVRGRSAPRASSTPCSLPPSASATTSGTEAARLPGGARVPTDAVIALVRARETDAKAPARPIFSVVDASEVASSDAPSACRALDSHASPRPRRLSPSRGRHGVCSPRAARRAPLTCDAVRPRPSAAEGRKGLPVAVSRFRRRDCSRSSASGDPLATPNIQFGAISTLGDSMVPPIARSHYPPSTMVPTGHCSV